MTKKKEVFGSYDTADYLKSKEDIAAYLEACSETNDPVLMAVALRNVARARNTSSGTGRALMDRGREIET